MVIKLPPLRRKPWRPRGGGGVIERADDLARSVDA
jgi:hypothetical protein